MGLQDAPPLIYVIPLKEGGAPANGARLLARLEKHGENYEARVIRRLESETPSRILGVLRETPRAVFRLEPIDEKARTEYALDKNDLGGAKKNDLVATELAAADIARFCAGAGGGTHRQHGFAARPSVYRHP